MKNIWKAAGAAYCADHSSRNGRLLYRAAEYIDSRSSLMAAAAVAGIDPAALEPFIRTAELAAELLDAQPTDGLPPAAVPGCYPAQPEAWEYVPQTVWGGQMQDIIEMARRMGVSGWELCATDRQPGAPRVDCYFKRRVMR